MLAPGYAYPQYGLLWLSGQQAVGLTSGGFVIALWVSDLLDVKCGPHQLYTQLFTTLSDISLFLVKLLCLEYASQAKRVFREEREVRVTCQ